MSRFRRFAHSLMSGYVLLGVNILYTLASVPLAWKYLSIPEFALWSLTSTIAQYIALIDLGMAGTSRILIDYKDKKEEGIYGSVIQTFLLVSLVQAALIVVIGSVLAAGLAPVLRIPDALQRAFIVLTIGQCALLAGSFLTRILAYLLAAHQRYDLANYSQTLIFLTTFGVLWLGFANHQGVYSTLWSQLAGWCIGALISLGWVVKLKLLPPRGCWGRPNWSRFRELFIYGRDIFLFALGSQLLSASQVAIVTRGLGLEVAAVWAVCTRTFFLVSQMIYRILDYSAPALAEMIVRKEPQLCSRFKSLVILSTSCAVVAGAMFAVCNQPFVRLWIGDKAGWSPLNDALLAIWLLFLAPTRCHLGLVGQTKQFGWMPYLYLFEGAFFVSLALIVLHWGGVSAMLAASIAGTLLFSSPYGSWRTGKYFNLPWKTVALDWMLPPLRLALRVVPVAILVGWLTFSLPPRPRFVICGGITGLTGLLFLFRFGLDESLRSEMVLRFPERLRSLLPLLNGRKKKELGAA